MSAGSRTAGVAATRHGPSDFVDVVLLTVGLALVLPYIMIIVLGGSLVRATYPAYILTAGGFIIVKRRPFYPAFMLAVFAFSPFLRRVADYQAGFAVFNLILLAPYVGLLPTIPAYLRRVLHGSGVLRWPLAMLGICVIYAAFVAMFQLAFVPAIYEALRWLLPVSLCAFVMEQPDDAVRMRRVVLLTLGLLVPILTAYGVYQFLYAPLWDVFWLSNIDNPTFGEGQAFKIRVFSMMNSPGSVAVFSALAMILLAGEGSLGMAIAALGLPLLGLSVIRTAWLALAVGLMILFWKASAASRAALVTGVVTIGFATTVILASSSLPPDVRNLITDRVATFSSLETDNSTYDRLRVYARFLDRLADTPWGEGFGANESTVTRQQSRRDLSSIDSGLLEAYLIYGVLVGTLYFASMILIVREAWIALSYLPARFAGHIAVVCAVVAMLPLGSVQIGESGVLLWTTLGLLMASRMAQQEGRI